jgi:hypothetical protein
MGPKGLIYVIINFDLKLLNIGKHIKDLGGNVVDVEVARRIVTHLIKLDQLQARIAMTLM